ncbi:CHAT domain-containing protein [Kribbella sandramycini]|uniref:CHAT domain-containing protein n=1 Tax=Kribbella sandramycini TaxID=60450 RepID=A0A7Y4NZQ1_9ACTN|nr:CHAT domain-containing tetratricopeptide repeat protein [Kribbella sandramycini]MBB6569957.1 tetratricopeptide (TPR) repeat protein [Kribbella sandramycini]NOL40219.1 CHAT domain-containing protein [Kribbella sandramycini]
MTVVPEELLPLALSRPHDAIAAAQTLLAGSPAAETASIAHQATGIGLRQLGEVDSAIRELRTALRLAKGVPDREADVLATLGATLGRAGRSREGLAKLDRAVELSRGALAGRVLLRRADVLLMLGRHREALEDLRIAITRLRRSGDQLWEARSRNYRGVIQLALGGTRQADADFDQAGRLYAAIGQEFEYAETRQNRGMVAFARWDLPVALQFLGEAVQGFEAIGVVWPDLTIDRCAVLLAAGLTAEALAEADEASGRMETVQAAKRADVLFAAAGAALAVGDSATAQERAERARRLFSAQRRTWWSVRASMLQLEARYQSGERGPRLLQQVVRTARRLDEFGTADAAAAHLLAGRLALAEGRLRTADRQLELAGRLTKNIPPPVRSAAWLGRALRAEARGETRRMLTACTRGLDALDDYRLMMGATELRARATGHGAELAELALRHALRRNDPHSLLTWGERWRATALTVPPVRPPDDEQLVQDLAQLRDVVRRLESTPEPTRPPALERDRRRLESAVRHRALHAQGAPSGGETRGAGADPHPTGAAAPAGAPEHDSRGQAADQTPRAGAAGAAGGVGAGGAAGAAAGAAAAGGAGGRAGAEVLSAFSPRLFDVQELHGALGDSALVELLEVDGVLHAVVAAGGELTHYPVGGLAAAGVEVERSRFRLRWLAHGRSRSGPSLEVLGQRLGDAILGPVQGVLGDRDVVMVPPARLQALPWGLIPALEGRAVNVVPSAAVWLRARRLRPPAERRVVLVLGPGLSAARAEITRLTEQYPDAVVLRDGDATAERVLKELDGAWIAHIAAHGTFRSDSPLFSSLRLDDGPLTVYDFERLKRAPYRLVLSSCDSGLAKPVGADELLGLSSSLVPLGAAGILASVVPVNDPATVPLMTALHAHLQNGHSLAEAFARARAAAGTDPVADAASRSFIALGA